MPEADTSSQTTRSPIRLTQWRREEALAGLHPQGTILRDGPNDGFGTIIGTASTSAVGGIGAVAVR
jgi:hypothetical protein